MMPVLIIGYGCGYTVMQGGKIRGADVSPKCTRGGCVVQETKMGDNVGDTYPSNRQDRTGPMMTIIVWIECVTHLGPPPRLPFKVLTTLKLHSLIANLVANHRWA